MQGKAIQSCLLIILVLIDSLTGWLIHPPTHYVASVDARGWSRLVSIYTVINFLFFVFYLKVSCFQNNYAVAVGWYHSVVWQLS